MNWTRTSPKVNASHHACDEKTQRSEAEILPQKTVQILNWICTVFYYAIKAFSLARMRAGTPHGE